MRGYQSTENVAVRSNSANSFAATGLKELLICIGVGVAAGLAVTLMNRLRLNPGLTGHKVLFWMPMLIVARLTTRYPIGASVGSAATAATCLGFGTNLAGLPLYMPLIVLAGSVLDAAAGLAEHRRLPVWLIIPLFGAAGMIGATLCAVKRLLSPSVKWHLFFGIPDPAASMICWAFFGLLAGLIGAALATGVIRLARRKKNKPPQPSA